MAQGEQVDEVRDRDAGGAAGSVHGGVRLRQQQQGEQRVADPGQHQRRQGQLAEPGQLQSDGTVRDARRRRLLGQDRGVGPGGRRLPEQGEPGPHHGGREVHQALHQWRARGQRTQRRHGPHQHGPVLDSGLRPDRRQRHAARASPDRGGREEALRRARGEGAGGDAGDLLRYGERCDPAGVGADLEGDRHDAEGSRRSASSPSKATPTTWARPSPTRR